MSNSRSWSTVVLAISMLTATAVATPPSQSSNGPSGQKNARHTPDVPQMSNDELKQFIAENPELKKQMQDYADDLRRQGKSNDDVLLAVYQRLNELHAEQVHEIAQAQTPQRFESREVTRDNSASVGRYESGDIARTQAGEVQRQGSQSVQGYQSDGIQQQRAQDVRRDRARSVRRDRAQSVREMRADAVQQTRAQDVQEYRGQKVQQYRAQDIQQDQAQNVQRYQAQDVTPHPAENPSNPGREIRPDPSRNQQRQSNSSAGSQFFHNFGLAVPGVVYSYDNYATNTRTTVTATGAVTKSAIRINPYIRLEQRVGREDDPRSLDGLGRWHSPGARSGRQRLADAHTEAGKRQGDGRAI